jgi:hypothetical protein
LKKNAPKLVIHRETLRNLDRAAGGQGAAAVSTQSPCPSIMDNCPSFWYTCDCQWTEGVECPLLITDTCAC